MAVAMAILAAAWGGRDDGSFRQTAAGLCRPSRRQLDNRSAEGGGRRFGPPARSATLAPELAAPPPRRPRRLAAEPAAATQTVPASAAENAAVMPGRLRLGRLRPAVACGGGWHKAVHTRRLLHMPAAVGELGC